MGHDRSQEPMTVGISRGCHGGVDGGRAPERGRGGRRDRGSASRSPHGLSTGGSTTSTPAAASHRVLGVDVSDLEPQADVIVRCGARWTRQLEVPASEEERRAACLAPAPLPKDVETERVAVELERAGCE